MKYKFKIRKFGGKREQYHLQMKLMKKVFAFFRTDMRNILSQKNMRRVRQNACERGARKTN
jgi:hypothetical protein